jgi:hypothetical protein
MQLPLSLKTVRRLLLLLFGSLSCLLVAAAAEAATAQPSSISLSCPEDLITLDNATSATVIDVKPGRSYKLGSGVYILNSTVEVPADAAL